MQTDFEINGQHAVLTLSSSAPLNKALLCAVLEWDRAMPSWRSMHERDAIAAALAYVSQLLGVTPLIIDCDASLPQHTGYMRKGGAKVRSKELNAPQPVLSPKD